MCKMKENQFETIKRIDDNGFETGVESFAIFQNAGYKGLYGGLTMQDIHKRKN